MLSTYNSWKIDISKVKQDSLRLKDQNLIIEEETYMEYISPYIVINNTGYPIEVQSDSFGTRAKGLRRSRRCPKIYCENGETRDLMLDFNINQFFQSKENATALEEPIHRSVMIIVQHEKYISTPITKVNIDRIGSSRFVLKCKKKDKPENEIESGEVVTEVKEEWNNKEDEFYILCTVNLVNSKKVVTISSSVLLTNKLSSNVYLELECQGMSKVLTISPSDTASIPFDFIKHGMMHCLGPSDSLEKSNGLRVEDLMSPAQILSEVCVAGQHIIVRPINNKGLMTLSFEAPFSIKNCCPVTIQYEFRQEGNQPETKKIRPQELTTISKFTRDTDVFIKACMDGCKWSKEVLIYSNNSMKKIPEYLELVDLEGHTVIISFLTSAEAFGTYDVVTYSKVMIINETLEDLEFYEHDHKIINRYKKLPGQAKDFRSNVLLLSEDTKEICIARKAQPNLFSSTFKYDVEKDNPVATIEDSTNQSAYEYSIFFSNEKCGEYFEVIIINCETYNNRSKQ